ncbi:MAG: hypothetical protein HKN62_09735 [Phycisphaerales bacterium]|nr:hypothetical protein [Phycisphaerales bacterium]
MRPMHSIFLTLSIIMLASCGTINSGLNIPPGEEFRLGENQHGAFTVSAENDGDVPVTVLSQDADGTRTKLATLEPGAIAKQQFDANTVAVFLNETERGAQLAVTIKGDTNLTMGYASE